MQCENHSFASFSPFIYSYWYIWYLLIFIDIFINIFIIFSRIYKDGVDSTQVHELQQRLHEKDMKLTDTQLEALSSAAQLEQLRETMNRMKVREHIQFNNASSL